MGRLIKWLKVKLTSLFRKKGDIVPAGIQVFDEHGETVADLSTGLTKIIWTKTFTKIEPEFSVKFDIAEGQQLFALGNLYGAPPSDWDDIRINYIIKGDTVTFRPKSPTDVGKPCYFKTLVGVCE
nr:MAG TPA: hypothetical protein [Caudoviricetes sp.]